MEPVSPQRLHGVLFFWHLSANGGFGKVITPDQQLFFLHRKLIVSGDPIPGSGVTFTPLPPLEGKKLPRAADAVIENSKAAR